MSCKARFSFGQAFPNSFYTLRAQCLVLALGKDQTGLPVVIALQNDKNAPLPDTPKSSSGNFRFVRKLWQAEPEYVHGRSGLDGIEASETTHGGKPPVRTY